VKLRKKGAKDAIEVNISLVIVKQNVHELADFIELGNRLGVNHIYLRTLQPVGNSAAGLNYHMLPPYLHPEFELYRAKAIDAIKSSKVPVEAEPDTWGTRIFPPEVEAELEKNPPQLISRSEARKSDEIRAVFDSQKPGQDVGNDPMKLRFEVEYERRNLEDPYGRKPRFECRFIYYNLNLNDFYFALNPCCYMERVPGHPQVYFNGTTDFFESWNSEAFMDLRRKLVEGPLYSYCRKCPFQG
jgi:MoaA/NifB/PqqE/SkfB family radical SAM enzyme